MVLVRVRVLELQYLEDEDRGGGEADGGVGGHDDDALPEPPLILVLVPIAVLTEGRTRSEAPPSALNYQDVRDLSGEKILGIRRIKDHTWKKSLCLDLTGASLASGDLLTTMLRTDIRCSCGRREVSRRAEVSRLLYKCAPTPTTYTVT